MDAPNNRPNVRARSIVALSGCPDKGTHSERLWSTRYYAVMELSEMACQSAIGPLPAV
jgi:hypothetical protein